MKDNNNTPDATEADVGHEKTHYQNKKVDPETWEGGLVRWASQVGQ